MRQRAMAILAALGAASVFSCGGDSGGTEPVDDGAGQPAQIQVLSAPDGGLVGSTATVRVRVLDGRGVGMEGVTVRFAVVASGGRITPESATTDAQGAAEASWTLGSAPGTHRLRVMASPITTELSAQAVLPREDRVLTSLEVTGVPASARLADTLQLTVRALDQDGEGMPDVPFSLEVTAGGGSVPVASVTTDRNGIAPVRWALGIVPGPQALAVGSGGVTASAELVAFRPALGGFGTVTGSGQEAPMGWTLPDSIRIQVVDKEGRPLPSMPVLWQVVAGGGSIDPSAPATDATGFVTAQWTLGVGATQQQLSVQVTDEDNNSGAGLLLSASAFEGIRITSELGRPREGRAYDNTLSAWGGRQGSEYRWGVAQGVLPPGIGLTPEGRLAGTPEADGVYPVTLRATDDEGTTGDRSYEFRVCEGAVTLAVGEAQVHSYPRACGPLLPAVSGAVYRVGVMSRGTDHTWTRPVDGGLRLTMRPPSEEGSAQAGASSAVAAAISSPPRDHTRPWGFEQDLVERAARERAFRPGPERSGFAAATADPPDQRTFTAVDAQGNVVTLTATLRAFTPEVAYYEDPEVSAEGGQVYEQSRIQEVLEWYGQNAHPVIEQTFGGYGPDGVVTSFTDDQGNPVELPGGDLDQNGRLVALQLRPSLMTGFQGFVTGCDLLPRPEHAAAGFTACPVSNEGEIVYVRGPGGSLLAHEAKHVSSISWIIYGAKAPETAWIEEGTAVTASELASRRASGVGPTERAGASRVLPGGEAPSTADDEYLMWASVVTGFRFLRAAPHAAITGDPEPNPSNSSFYSSSWFFHRFLLDRYGGADPHGLMRRLNTEAGGVEGRESVTGKSLAQLFTEFMHAVMVDDHPEARNATENRFRSYDFAGIIEADATTAGRWPGAVAEVDFGSASWELPTWETALNLFELRASGSEGVVLDVSALDEAAPVSDQDVILMVVRVR